MQSSLRKTLASVLLLEIWPVKTLQYLLRVLRYLFLLCGVLYTFCGISLLSPLYAIAGNNDGGYENKKNPLLSQPLYTAFQKCDSWCFTCFLMFCQNLAFIRFRTNQSSSLSLVFVGWKSAHFFIIVGIVEGTLLSEKKVHSPYQECIFCTVSIHGPWFLISVSPMWYFLGHNVGDLQEGDPGLRGSFFRGPK